VREPSFQNHKTGKNRWSRLKKFFGFLFSLSRANTLGSLPAPAMREKKSGDFLKETSVGRPISAPIPIASAKGLIGEPVEESPVLSRPTSLFVLRRERYRLAGMARKNMKMPALFL
jgi:hypothetical protein